MAEKSGGEVSGSDGPSVRVLFICTDPVKGTGGKLGASAVCVRI
jgi:hypothetical protein